MSESSDGIPAEDIAMKALLAMINGKDVLALALLDQIATVNPDHPLVGWGRAQTLMQQGQLQEALQEARQAVGIHPEESITWYILAKIAWEIGNKSMTQSAYEKCFEICGESEEYAPIFLEYACFMEENRAPSVAEPIIEKAVRLLPDSPNSWLALGRLRIRQHRSAEAESCFKRAIEIQPDHPVAQMNLGWFYQDLGRTSEAQALFQLAADNELTNPAVEEMEEVDRQKQAWQKIFERKEVQDELFGEANASHLKRIYLLIFVLAVFVVPIAIAIYCFDRGWSGLVLIGILTILSMGWWVLNIWLGD